MSNKINISGTYTTVHDYGCFDWVDIGGDDLSDKLNSLKLENKKVRITIEVLEDEVIEEDEPTINFTLRQIIQSNEAIEGLRLNPYCLNEGADPYARYEIKLSDAKKWGLI